MTSLARTGLCAVHDEQWYRKSASPKLPGVAIERIDDNRLQRAFDTLLPHRAELEPHLKQRMSDDAEAFATLALVYRLQNEPLAECLKPLQHALALDPVLISALLNRAYLLAEAGRVQQARQDFQTVLRLVPQHPKALAGLRMLSQTPGSTIPPPR